VQRYQWFLPFQLRLPLIQSYLPQLALMGWCLPLLLLSSGQDSLLAHDEGLYALRGRAMFDSGDWVNPWGTPHHKTPGIYWAIALCYRLFGVSEFAARLPSVLASLAAVLLLYAVGRQLYSQSIAWLGGAILGTEILWVRYSRMAGPDMPMIALFLLALWCLLRSEAQDPAFKRDPVQRDPVQRAPIQQDQILTPIQRRWLFGGLAGLCIGLAFLVRGFLVVLAIAALFPYLLLQHRRHRHLLNPAVYLGVAAGLLPLGLWVWANYQRFGWAAVAQLLGLVVDLGSNQRESNNAFYYLWNIPLNALPWSGVAVWGAVLISRYAQYRSLLLGVPLVILLGLHGFSTRLAHYSLLLYPWISLAAAVGLVDLGQRLRPLHRRIKVWGWSWSLGLALAAGSFLVKYRDSFGRAEVLEWKYGLVLLAGLVGLTGISQLFRWALKRQGVGNALGPLAVHGLIGCWCALAIAGTTGLLNDHNPQVRQFVARPEVAAILRQYPIDFAAITGKPAVLFKFYTPHWGAEFSSLAQLPRDRYAWTCLKDGATLPTELQLLGEAKKCQLVKS
jgi:4-amino-4-deoxy-L-arabinose transferase-like glycosyltransferase